MMVVTKYYRQLTCIVNDRDVVIMGQANAGKSTLINAISDSDITISRYPGTTLDLITIDMEEYNIYDTPGLIRKDNMQYFVDENQLKKVIPSKVKTNCLSS